MQELLTVLSSFIAVTLASGTRHVVSGGVAARNAQVLYEHGADFVPDQVLRITLDETFSIACQTSPSVLVNGSSPGPPLSFEAGKPQWIRVFNDMEKNNFTMV